MSMNFDLEAAKRGEPIEYQEAYGWVEIKFIGGWNDGHIVCSVPWSYKPEMVAKSLVRMGNRKEVVRYRVVLMKRFDDKSYFTMSFNSEEDSEYLERDQEFVKWLTDWQEYEIGASE